MQWRWHILNWGDTPLVVNGWFIILIVVIGTIWFSGSRHSISVFNKDKEKS